MAADWTERSGRHVQIFYNEAPKDFVDAVEKATEEYYDSIIKDLGFRRTKSWAYKNRVKIYIYDSSEDYVTAGRQARWSHGSASPTERTIRTFPTAHGFFDSTLPHELGHIIFREFVGYNADVPLWFEEGVAMYVERARRFGSHDLVREAIKADKFIPLEQLTLMRPHRGMSKKGIELFYAESASAVKFLINEHGTNKFVRFCRKLKDGKPFEWALDSIYVRYKNIERLNKAWVKFLEDD